MNKLSSTAKNLDIFFKVQGIVISICIVGTLVGLGIIAAGFLFDLDPYAIGTGYNSPDFGPLSIEIAEGYAPDAQLVLILTAVELVIALICLLILRPCVTCVRDILEPMTKGEPFHNTISSNLKKLAKSSMILCILVNCMEIATTAMYVRVFDLANLILSEKITHVTFLTEFDLTFLIVAAVLYLLSYIFRYGEELQQFSDETL